MEQFPGGLQRPSWPANIDELNQFVRAFEDGTLPNQCWSHSGHIAAAIHYLTRHRSPDALAIIRGRIKAYNERQGVANTATSGYHETLTTFWLGVLANFVATQRSAAPESSIIDITAAAIARFEQARSFPADLYTFPIIHDPRARRQWVAPDIWTGLVAP